MCDTADRGRCCSCGFLCVETTPPCEGAISAQVFEVPWTARENGQVFTASNLDKLFVPLDVRPACARRIAGLEEEIGDARNDFHNDRAKAARHIINRDRGCEEWYRYRPGLSPAEHLQECRMLELEQTRRDWERKLEQDRRSWEKELEQDRRRWEERLDHVNQERDRKAGRIMVWLAVVGIFLAAVEITTAVIAITIGTR